MGSPRELNSMQAVPAIVPPGVPAIPATPLPQGAAWPSAVCVLGGAAPILSVPNVTPCDSCCTGLVPTVHGFTPSPAVCQQPVPPLPPSFHISHCNALL